MYDYMVVGGGVVGLSLAWELARKQQRVCVMDRGQVGSATSWVGAGILPPPKVAARHDALEQLRAASHELHREWARRLLAETEIDNQLRTCGGIYVARRAGEAVALQVEMQQSQADGIQCERLSSQQLIEREQALAPIAGDVLSAYLLPQEMQLRSPRHLQALRAACLQAGVTLRENVDARRFLVEGDRVVGIQTDKETEGASNYCLCSGPWAAQLLEPMGICLPVEPWRGQLQLWKTPKPLLTHVVNEGMRYLVPRSDGCLLAGATVEDVGFDCETTDEATEELCRFTQSLLPQLSNQRPEQTWAGLRPKTPDGHPFMDRVPGIENLSVCVGHYRSGLHLSPASAVFMAGLLLDDTVPGFDPAPFRLQR